MLNILICGTPGTGKSTIIEKLKPLLPDFNFVNISDYALKNNFITIFDETLSSHVLDEEKLFEALNPLLEAKKLNIIESIHAGIFQDEEIDCVFICRASNTNLHDRLTARGYSGKKLENNLEAEIFQSIYDEACEEFSEHKIMAITNNNFDDLDKNVDLIKKTVQEIQKSH